jgi:pilus assembly protein Flp/PilA
MFDLLISPEKEKGQGMVEYGMILVLVGVVLVVVLALVGPAIGNVFSQVTCAVGRTCGSSTGGTGGTVTPPVLSYVLVLNHNEDHYHIMISCTENTSFTLHHGTISTSGTCTKGVALNFGNVYAYQYTLTTPSGQTISFTPPGGE